MGPGVDPEVVALLRLKVRPGLGDRGIARLVRLHGSAMAAERASRSQKEIFKAEETLRPEGPWEDPGLRILPMTGPDYPDRLHELSDPPPVLFLRGNVSLLQRPSVAVVGARKATESGRAMAEALGRSLGRAGINVVSGMALGIDGAAHRGAMEVGGHTTAVLGSGLHVVYPRSHRQLFKEIETTGLLVSEFLPGERALPHHFPRRNRIIAALASAIIVVEAGSRSGALITVDHGLDLGREILALPGSPGKPQSRGTNTLIVDGARLVRDPDRILEDLPGSLLESLDPPPPGRPTSTPDPGSGGPGAQNRLGLPPGLEPLWRALHDEPQSADEVAEGSGLTQGEALAGLSALELLGMVRRCSGMRFRRD